MTVDIESSFRDYVPARSKADNGHAQLQALADHIKDSMVPAVAEAVLNVLPPPLKGDRLADLDALICQLLYTELKKKACQLVEILPSDRAATWYEMADALRETSGQSSPSAVR